jgi:nucleoside-diphosphate-sugar epimerase
VRVWELPPWLLDNAAIANRTIARVVGKPPMLTPEKLRELRHPDWVCDNNEVRALLGWEPSTLLRRGLAATPGWSG